MSNDDFTFEPALGTSERNGLPVDDEDPSRRCSLLDDESYDTAVAIIRSSPGTVFTFDYGRKTLVPWLWCVICTSWQAA